MPMVDTEVVVFGVISIGISFLVMEIGGPVTQICTSLLGSLGGPVSGLFLIGAFFPWANSKGVIIGGIAGFGCCMWVTLGSQISGISTPWLELGSTDSCPANLTGDLDLNTTMSMVTEAVKIIKSPETRVGLERLYALSFTCYSLFGLLITFVVTIVVSALTGLTIPKDINPMYVSHLIRGCFYTEKEIENAKASLATRDIELLVKKPLEEAVDGMTEDGNEMTFKPVTPPPHVTGSLRRPLIKDPDEDLSWKDEDNQ